MTTTRLGPTLALTLLVAGLLAAQQPAQEEPPPAGGDAEAGTEEAAAEEPAAPIDPAAPGPFHASLEPEVGEWDLTLRLWTDPTGEPVESRGTAETRWILDGRFVETRLLGDALGRSFEARIIEGYDNNDKQYVRTWRDTLGTYTMVYRGTANTEGTVRTLVAQFTDPGSGLALRNRAVITHGEGFPPATPEAETETAEGASPAARAAPAPEPPDPELIGKVYLYQSFLITPDGTEYKNLELEARRR